MESDFISGIEYPVFDNLKEYQDYHMERLGVVPIVAQDWRTAKKDDWVWSEDPDIKESHLDYRRIVQILYQKDKIKKVGSDRLTTGHCRTIVGTYIQNLKYKMDTDLTLRKYPQGRYQLAIHSNILSAWDRIVTRKEISKKERYFCVRVATGADPFEVYSQVFGSKSIHGVRDKTMLLLKQERIMGKITEDIVKIAKNLGIDHEKVIKRYDDLFKNSKDDEFKYKVNEKMGDIIGTHGEAQRIRTTFGAGAIFQGFTPQQLEDAEMTQLPSGDKDEDES